MGGNGTLEGCGLKQPKVMRQSLGILIELHPDSEKLLDLNQKNSNDRKFPLSPDEALKILKRISP